MTSNNGTVGNSSSTSTTSSYYSNSNRHRRRRMQGETGPMISPISEKEIPQPQPEEEDYYTDSDDDDDGNEKGHHNDKKKRVSATCSFGQFVLNPCLCCFQTLQQCYFRSRQIIVVRIQGSHDGKGRRQRRRHHQLSTTKHRWDQIDLILIVGISLSVLASFYYLFPSFASIMFSSTSTIRRRYSDDNYWGIRAWIDDEVNHLPILIPSFDRSKRRTSSINENDDIGGWRFVQRPIFKPSQPVDIGQPDRNNLLFYGTFGKTRIVHQHSIDSDPIAAIQYNITNPKIRREVAQSNMYAEQLEDTPTKCRRVNWKMLYHPTCNEIHTLALDRDYREEAAAKLGDDQSFDSFYISHGYYRDVWVVNQMGVAGEKGSHDSTKRTVIKMSRFRSMFSIKDIQKDLRDALVMERLTSSPNIIDIYGHCGTSVQVEALPYEIEEVIVPGTGYIKHDRLHDADEVKPRNDYTAEEKLELALAMAESLADLHGFEDGVM